MFGKARFARTPPLLAAILLVALLLRLRGLAFGLPALYDPDEPIFILTGLKLLRDHTLNPGWFGHPGTTTIYTLALIDIVVYAIGHLSGRLPDTAAFGRAIYSDPTIVFLPARGFIVLCALLCILLTYLVARRLFDARTGLLAAALLAIDPIHIRYSQVIRTDMHATMFVLLVVLAAIGVARTGRTRDYLLAGVALGFACATKWPSVAAGAGVIGATVLRWRCGDERPRLARRVGAFLLATVAALFVASPYLFLDTATVIDNLRGEERPFHLGATGHGLAGNMAWYLLHPLWAALGAAGLAFAGLGLWLGWRRSPAFAAVVVVVGATFFVSISAQALIWERWVVPLLPFLTIATAVGVLATVRRAEALWGRAGLIAGAVAAGLALAPPLLLTDGAQAAERARDTRRLATDWARAHVAPGSSVAIEYFAFDVLSRPWRFVYPAGDKGCVDVRANLSGKIRYSTIGRWRGRRPVVDLGNVPPELLNTCRADWLVIVNYDRYLAEAARYPEEIATYRRLMTGGRLAAIFRPVAGQVGGPVVRVVRLGAGPARR